MSFLKGFFSKGICARPATDDEFGMAGVYERICVKCLVRDVCVCVFVCVSTQSSIRPESSVGFLSSTFKGTV